MECETELLQSALFIRHVGDERIRRLTLRTAKTLLWAVQCCISAETHRRAVPGEVATHVFRSPEANSVLEALRGLRFRGLSLEEFAASDGAGWTGRIMLCRGEPDVYDERRVGVVQHFLGPAAVLSEQLCYWVFD
ncbi:hypothetical protein JKP88DRAFT_273037 [Tribonema minus]|uniref:Uncharacterized protein n=1 Tax=Tribonema minus TaxID=303371 RepID=A0A835YX24_9STRA|nr:hypothetical protein JKP88DRAFT_273037 [Tribonema minus]